MVTVVVHTASGFHTGCARSLILGLADRKEKTGADVHYLHVSLARRLIVCHLLLNLSQTSGTSSLADSPILHRYPNHPGGTFSDDDPAHVVSTLKMLNDAATYPQRTTDLEVLSLGQQRGVRTYIFFLPIIYGLGLGEFNRISGQIPTLMRAARRDGYTCLVSGGEGTKSHIHIEDIGTFYEIILHSIVEGRSSVPCGQEGVIFVESGYQSYKDISEGIAKAGASLGIITNAQLKTLNLEEALRDLKWSNITATELGFVSRLVPAFPTSGN